MTKDHLNIIINMAARDSQIEERELRIIRMIAKASGMSEEDLDGMLSFPQPIKNLPSCSENEQFETLYHLIQVMKADGQVFKSEISFCQDIAEKLGYRKEVVADLSTYIYASPFITSDRDMLVKKAKKFLK